MKKRYAIFKIKQRQPVLDRELGFFESQEQAEFALNNYYESHVINHGYYYVIFPIFS